MKLGTTIIDTRTRATGIVCLVQPGKVWMRRAGETRSRPVPMACVRTWGALDKRRRTDKPATTTPA